MNENVQFTVIVQGNGFSIDVQQKPRASVRFSCATSEHLEISFRDLLLIFPVTASQQEERIRTRAHSTARDSTTPAPFRPFRRFCAGKTFEKGKTTSNSFTPDTIYQRTRFQGVNPAHWQVLCTLSDPFVIRFGRVTDLCVKMAGMKHKKNIRLQKLYESLAGES